MDDVKTFMISKGYPITYIKQGNQSVFHMSCAQALLIQGELCFCQLGKIIHFNTVIDAPVLVLVDIGKQFNDKLLVARDFKEYMVLLAQSGSLGLFLTGKNGKIATLKVIENFMEFIGIGDNSITLRPDPQKKEDFGACEWNQGFVITITFGGPSGFYVGSYYLMVDRSTECVVKKNNMFRATYAARCDRFGKISNALTKKNVSVLLFTHSCSWASSSCSGYKWQAMDVIWLWKCGYLYR